MSDLVMLLAVNVVVFLLGVKWGTTLRDAQNAEQRFPKGDV